MVLWGAGQLTWVWKHGGNSIPAMGFQPKPTDSCLLSRCTAIFRFCFTFAFMLSCRLPKAWWVCLCASWAGLGFVPRCCGGAPPSWHYNSLSRVSMTPLYNHVSLWVQSLTSQFKSCLVKFRRAWELKCVTIAISITCSILAWCKLKEYAPFMNHGKGFCLCF